MIGRSHLCHRLLHGVVGPPGHALRRRRVTGPGEDDAIGQGGGAMSQLRSHGLRRPLWMLMIVVRGHLPGASEDPQYDPARRQSM